MQTDIEQKALALLNEVCAEMGLDRVRDLELNMAGERALLRAIEQHKAYKQEVSDACNAVWDLDNFGREQVKKFLSRFIIPKPVDPLVEAVDELWTQDKDKARYMADQLHAYLTARGYEFTKIGEKAGE